MILSTLAVAAGGCLVGQGGDETSVIAGVAEFCASTADAACHRGDVGSGNFCDSDCPCGYGEGDCDSDSDCSPGLVCGKNIGSDFGMSGKKDVCVLAGYPADQEQCTAEPEPEPTCGDGSCDAGEDAASCPADCDSTICGDGSCDAGEDAASCPADCDSTTGGGEDDPLIAWDGLADDPAQGIKSWGRLASCSREGEDPSDSYCSDLDSFDRLSVVPDPDYGHVYQAAMTSGDVYRGKARAEFAKPELDDGEAFYIYHGDEYYIGFRSKLSVGFDSLGDGDSNSGNIMQLKGKLSCGGPALGLTIKDGYLTLRRETDDSSDIDIDADLLGNREGVFWRGPRITDLEGEWFEIVFRVNFNIDPSIGFVEVWLNGVKQSGLLGTTTIHGKTMCFDSSEERVELKLGIYRNERYNKSGSFDYHWLSDPRIGHSFSAVAPR